MSVFLIQTSGTRIDTNADPAYVAAANGPRFCDEPLLHGRYLNADPHWEQGFHRRRAWQRAAKGDVALLYCTGSVDEFPSSLSHVLPIENKRIVQGEGAWLEFLDAIELDSVIDYATIQELTERGGFSSGMEDCGREGFNIRPVDDQNYTVLRVRSSPVEWTWDEIDELLKWAPDSAFDR